jgi:hypothetical protein
MQEQLRVVVRAPSRVQVIPSVGRPEITSRGDGSIDVDGHPFISADGRIRPFDVHRYTYTAVGGDGYASWEHGPSLPLSIRVDDVLRADVCLSAGRYGCLEALQIQTPAENVVSVQREQHPNRLLGLIFVIAPLAITAVPIGATYAGSDSHSDVSCCPCYSWAHSWFHRWLSGSGMSSHPAGSTLSTCRHFGTPSLGVRSDCQRKPCLRSKRWK